MNNVANIAAVITLSAAQLAEYVRSAQDAYKNYKTTAMRSAANCYLVWLFTSSDQATDMARDWIKDQIADRNAEIERHNDNLPSLKERVNAYKASEIASVTAVELAEIEPYLAYTDTDWDKAVQTKIEAREGASPFTEVVKFVFGFDSASDASNISRYAKALEYVQARHGALTELTADGVVALLDKAGGLEGAINAVRNGEDGHANFAGGGAGDPQRDAKVRALKVAISNSATLTSFSYEPKFANDDYVFMIGRRRGADVAVYGELDLSENEANALVMKIDTDLISTLDPFAEFVARVAKLGSLVREGSASAYTVDGTQSGDKMKVARAYALCDATDGTTFMHVSARYTEASAVIVARPKSPVMLGTLKPKQFLMLPTEPATGFKTGKDMVKLVNSVADRIMFRFAATKEVSDAPVVWSALSNDPQNLSPAPEFVWGIMAKQKRYPVNVNRFNAQFTVVLNKSDVVDIHESYTSKWEKAPKNAKKVFLPLELSCDGVTLSLNHAKHLEKRIPVGSTLAANVALPMRPRDISDLIAILCEQNALLNRPILASLPSVTVPTLW